MGARVERQISSIFFSIFSCRRKKELKVEDGEHVAWKPEETFLQAKRRRSSRKEKTKFIREALAGLNRGLAKVEVPNSDDGE